MLAMKKMDKSLNKQRLNMQTVPEQVDELQKKISIKQRDYQSLFRKQHEIIDSNEVKIIELRDTVKEARQKLAKMMNKDNDVIETALRGHKFHQLQCKRYDVNTAKMELNEDVCAEHNKLNHYIHQKECRIRRLEELRLKLRDFELQQTTNFEREDEKRVRQLKTKFDKIVTKRDTAKYIQSTYSKTLNKLELDALTLHKDLDQLEWQVAANKEEVCDLKNMHVMAKNAKEKITEKIGFLEQDVHSQKAARDKELKNARKNAKIASHMPEVLFRNMQKNAFFEMLMIRRKSMKNSSLGTDSIDHLDEYKSVMEDFSTVINTEKVKEIPQVFQRQKETFMKLAEEAKELENELDKKEADLATAKQKLEEVLYMEKEHNTELDRETAELKKKLSDQTNNSAENRELMATHSNQLYTVLDGIHCIHEKLAPVVIKGIEQGPSTTTVKSEDMPISEQILEIDKKLTELSQSLPHDPVTIARKQAQARYEEEKNHDEIEEEIEQKCIYNAGHTRYGIRVNLGEEVADGSGRQTIHRDTRLTRNPWHKPF
jgi:Skp family chaperone for outer membrane proteins